MSKLILLLSAAIAVVGCSENEPISENESLSSLTFEFDGNRLHTEMAPGIMHKTTAQ